MIIRDKTNGLQGIYLGKVCELYDEYYIVKTVGGLKIYINIENAEILEGSTWEM